MQSTLITPDEGPAVQVPVMVAADLQDCLLMAAHDLQIPLTHLLERDPRMARDTGFSVPDPDGTRFGFWEIERLVGEP